MGHLGLVQNWFSLSGRMSPSEFRNSTVAIGGVSILFSGVYLPLTALLWWPFLALVAKRLRDGGRSPVLNFVWIGFLAWTTYFAYQTGVLAKLTGTASHGAASTDWLLFYAFSLVTFVLQVATATYAGWLYPQPRAGAA